MECNAYKSCNKRLAILFMALTLVSLANAKRVITGDERTELYFHLLEGKRIALYSNHTGLANGKHIVDILKENKFDVTTILSPEHGFRGTADAGERVGDSVDEKTNIPIISMYKFGREGIDSTTAARFDILVVDIQDVGLRFYTYYITMWRLMDSCAKYGKLVIVLDRPNPNGFYVDGPILDMKYRSGVGWLPIPIVHGMTLGELALMINGEGWLTDKRKCELTVIPCKNYKHSTLYELPIPPSPNLPNIKSIYLYPSTCFFEGTVMSLGRGTSLPFQVYGHPDYKGSNYSFTPQSISGAKNPPLLGKKCYGVDLSDTDDKYIRKQGIDLSYVIDAYKNLNIGSKFFTSFFDLLAGCSYVREMIEQGCDADEIKARWQDDVTKFKKQRAPYLIYK
jgi:uncharacterized protein YbbC (DUF1343 family)